MCPYIHTHNQKKENIMTLNLNASSMGMPIQDSAPEKVNRAEPKFLHLPQFPKSNLGNWFGGHMGAVAHTPLTFDQKRELGKRAVLTHA